MHPITSQLKKNYYQFINKFNPLTDVVFAELETGFQYGTVNSVTLKKINFSEQPNGKTLATDEVIILDEQY